MVKWESDLEAKGKGRYTVPSPLTVLAWLAAVAAIAAAFAQDMGWTL